MWVEDDEIGGLAAELSLSPTVFAERHLRRVADPPSGRLRFSIREGAVAGDSGAACALLENGRHCTVYSSRPRHCREFPFWPSILEDREAFECARAICPGIAVEPSEEDRVAALAALAALYEELEERLAAIGPRCESSGRCCRFEEAGHELFATLLETDLAALRHPEAPAPEAPGRCPYHQGGLCNAREGRPLGCRTYFCDSSLQLPLQELHEEFLSRVRRIERDSGYPAGYARFPELLGRLGIGTASAAPEIAESRTKELEE